MKIRDSGMPEESMWETFFDSPRILKTLGLRQDTGNVVEFGCGYGTFTIAAAKITGGTVFALDIEPKMIAATEARSSREGLRNVRAVLRDFVTKGTGLEHGNAGFAMLFNILHCERPVELFREAARNLREDGTLAAIHWRSDIATPRGPAMNIRPSPETCIQWARAAGLCANEPGMILLPPWHYGIAFRKARE